jgi:hypothetical protein
LEIFVLKNGQTSKAQYTGCYLWRFSPILSGKNWRVFLENQYYDQFSALASSILIKKTPDYAAKMGIFVIITLTP